MRPRAWPLAALGFGLAAFALIASFPLLPEVTAVYARAEVPDVVADFQRAATLDDLAGVFGDPANPQVAAAMDAINRLDLYAFVPVYTLFLVAAAAMFGRRGAAPTAAVLAALLGAGADAVETFKQLQLTAALQSAPEVYLPIAPWYWAKYAGLGLHGAAIAGLCFSGRRRRWVLGVLALAPAPSVLAFYFGAIDADVFRYVFAAYWIALLASAAIELVRARGVQA